MLENGEPITTVIDAGARYGIHPTWRQYKAPIYYYAFEPDETECENLKKIESSKWFSVYNLALYDSKAIKPFNITRHRGLSSFLMPDMSNEWYRRYRPGSGDIIEKKEVKTTTIDIFCDENNFNVDFLKIDTEGTEKHVLVGGEDQLERSVLGVRSSFSFMQFYHDQDMFSDIHEYLISHNFFLLNIDYHGYGVPRNFFFRKPDPLEPEQLRYGILMSSDGVWLKKYSVIKNSFPRDTKALAIATMKYAYFCLNNNAPDVCIDTLLDYIDSVSSSFDNDIKETVLFKALRRDCYSLLGRWRVYPDSQWLEIQTIYNQIFGLELLSGSEYWSKMNELDKLT